MQECRAEEEILLKAHLAYYPALATFEDECDRLDGLTL